MSQIKRFAFLPYIAFALFHFVVIAAGQQSLVDVTKPLLMPVLLLGFLVATPVIKTGITVMASVAFIFSWAGDVLLQSPQEMGFLLGLGAFLVAQVFFVLTFLKLGQGKLSPWSGLYFVWWIALIVVLAPGLNSLLVPVGIYGVVLGTMAVTATRVSKTITWGGAFFLASDTMLALDRFLPDFTLVYGDEFIMSTYMAAEGLIAYGVVRALRTRTMSN